MSKQSNEARFEPAKLAGDQLIAPAVGESLTARSPYAGPRMINADMERRIDR